MPPKKPGRVERRAAPRVPGGSQPGVPGQVTFFSSEIQGGGQVRNISVGGALISSSPPYPSLGSEVEMYFAQPERQEPLYAVGKVVHQTDSGFAVRFLLIQPELQQALSSLVQKKKKE